MSKIFRLDDGGYLAGAGVYDQIVEIVAWVQGGRKEEDRPAFSGEYGSNLIWVCPKGRGYWLTWPYLRAVRFKEPFAAVGSGSDFALGAMAAGATAKEAVEIACKYDEATGKGVDVVQLVKPTKKRK